MASYKTPGVYVKEISTLPASVAQVETAIPAFVGYTQKAMKKGESLLNKPTRIKSMVDFETYFGEAPKPSSINVSLTDTNEVDAVAITPQFYLYHSMQMFYNNGGGACYIVAVDTYENSGGSIDKDKLVDGIKLLKKFDEPTLFVVPDATLLDSAVDMADVQTAALAQCNDLQDRFAILDIFNGNTERSYDENDVVTAFRNNIGTKALKYGAAYYPWIKTSLDVEFGYSDVSLTKGGNPVQLENLMQSDEVDSLIQASSELEAKIDPLLGATRGSGSQTYQDIFNASSATTKARIASWGNSIKLVATDILKLISTGDPGKLENDGLIKMVQEKSKKGSKLFNIIKTLAAYDFGYASKAGDSKPLGVMGTDTNGKINEFNGQGIFDGVASYELSETNTDDTIYIGSAVADYIQSSESAFQALLDQALGLLSSIQADAQQTVASQEDVVTQTHPIYSNIVKRIREEDVVLPPSAAVAGVYAFVDSTRGVWKAPANISLSSTIGPTVSIDKDDQEDLNVDVVAGKSVNAIRSFTGKGTLLWGARTLAGNDNEWRYVSVRRFYNMVEESLKKATERVVFESNDANTWVKVKAQIENYLTVLWRDGALAGAVPEHAFFVNIGLGNTMTAQDILEGRMIIEIGMAVVRPAEFIIMKFSHKMQES